MKSTNSFFISLQGRKYQPSKRRRRRDVAEENRVPDRDSDPRIGRNRHSWLVEPSKLWRRGQGSSPPNSRRHRVSKGREGERVPTKAQNTYQPSLLQWRSTGSTKGQRGQRWSELLWGAWSRSGNQRSSRIVCYLGLLIWWTRKSMTRHRRGRTHLGLMFSEIF